MLTSYNGWTASANPADFGGISPLVIDGRSFAPGLRNGPVHTVFSHYFRDYDDLVEDLELGNPAADEWGFAFRQNRNANNLSCHGSATAGDANATLHPNGVRGTLNGPSKGVPGQSKIEVIRTLTKGKYRGLIRCGEDFTGTPDGMHHEIIGTEGQVAALAAELDGLAANAQSYVVQSGDTLSAIALRFGSTVLALMALNGLVDPNKLAIGQVIVLHGTVNLPAPAPALPQPWIMLPSVRSRPLSFQRWYNAYPFRPALLPIIRPLANNFGPQSLVALKKVQSRYGLVPDGIDGPLTKRVLWDLGWRG